MILLTAGVLTDPQLPTRASNVYTTDAGWVASAGWHRPDGIGRVPPPNKNPGYAGGTPSDDSSSAMPKVPNICRRLAINP